MKQITVKKNIDVPVTYLKVSAQVRYWEDEIIDGVEDEQGDLIPPMDGDNWDAYYRVVDW